MKELQKYTFLIILLYFIVYILIIGKTLILPFVIALLLAYFLIGMTNMYKRIFFKKKNSTIFTIFSFLFSLITFWCLIWIIVHIIDTNIDNIYKKAPQYQIQLEWTMETILEKLHLDKPENIFDIIDKINFQDFATITINTITNIASYAGIIIIYTIFILLEYWKFHTKFSSLIRQKATQKKIHSIMNTITEDIAAYWRIKTIVSILTGISSYIVLIIFQVDFPWFWALLIFILNYIPTIGSIIGVIFPIIISFIQFSNIFPFVMISIFLISIQIFIGNILEPRLMGKTLNLSPLVILISLTIWWSIWGVIGMFLSVPITVIGNIILSKFKKTRNIAILLSEDGMIK